MIKPITISCALASLVASDWVIVEQTDSRIVMVRPTETEEDSITLWDGESGGRLIAGAEWSTDAHTGNSCMTGLHEVGVHTNPTIWFANGNDVAIGAYDTLYLWMRADSPQRIGVKMRGRYDEDDTPGHAGEVFVDVTTDWDVYRIPRRAFENETYDALRVDHISFTVDGNRDKSFRFWVDDIGMAKPRV